MKPFTEGHLHVAARRFLRKDGWTLIAGQYPGGSDDELYALNVVDPELARDDSPDPRRHSTGKLVPDIVALSGCRLLICEVKPSYSQTDREKLAYLLSERRGDLMVALEKFSTERDIKGLTPVDSLILEACLVFSALSEAPVFSDGVKYLKIVDLDNAHFEEG